MKHYTRRSVVLRTLALAVAITGGGQVARAATLLSASPTTLYSLNSDTYVVTTLAQLSMSGLRGMALSPLGEIYGGFDGPNSTGILGTINRNTGQVTTIGAFANLPGSLSFDPSGNLFLGNAAGIFALNLTDGSLGSQFACGSALLLSFGANGVATISNGGPVFRVSAGAGCTGSGSGTTGSGTTGSGTTGSGTTGSGTTPTLLALTLGQSPDSYFGVVPDATQSLGASLISFNFSTQSFIGYGAAPRDVNSITLDSPTNFTPEPGSISLLAIGLLGAGLYSWKKR